MKISIAAPAFPLLSLLVLTVARSANISAGDAPQTTDLRSPNGTDAERVPDSIQSHQGGNDAKNNAWHVHFHQNQTFNTSSDLNDVAWKESEYFVSKIFHKYGEANNSLSYLSLRRLIQNLGLVVSVEEAESTAAHDDQNENKQKRAVVTHSHSSHDECFTLPGLLSAFHFDPMENLDPDRFMLLCPAIIDQLDNRGCHQHDDLHLGPGHGHKHHDGDKGQSGEDIGQRGDSLDEDHSNEHTRYSDAIDGISHVDDDIPGMTSLESSETREISLEVWLYSFLAIGVISLVGLLGVATIPIMRKMFYNTLLQLLIALAIGALSGDAFLHLLPHAMSSHGASSGSPSKHHHPAPASTIIPDNTSTSTTHHLQGHQHQHASSGGEDDHDTSSVWKGLLALLFLVFFFLCERLLHVLTSRRAKAKVKRQAKKKTLLLEVKSEEDGTQDPQPQAYSLETETDTFLNVFPIRETDIISDDDDDDNDDLNNDRGRNNGCSHRHSTEDATTRSSGQSQQQYHDEGRIQGHSEGHGQGHSHGHGHSHEVPQSMSAVVLMVIFGDGIHNFCDGLAIGAAFSGSIPSGFSTAVAVFCHELPHEIGDFAVLLNSGMSWKQAMMYNVLSSVLCAAGTVVGVLLGHVNEATNWIFCGVAGMFLYISMADMLPQLTVSETRPFHQLLVQCTGMAIGGSIMLIIAIFENELKALMS